MTGTTDTRASGSAARMRSVFVPPGSGQRWLTPWADTTSALVAAEQTGGAFTASHLVAPPGWRRPAYVHHAVDECFYIAHGEFEVILDDRSPPLAARAGAVVYVPRGVARSLRNVSREAGLLMLLQTPGRAEGPATVLGVEYVEAPEDPSSPAIPIQPADPTNKEKS